jgi:hypothetical protein
MPQSEGIETLRCLLTGAAVGACRAGSQVDFAFTGCCVAPSRSSLLPGKRYLSRSLPVYLLEPAYQWFCYLSIVYRLPLPHYLKLPDFGIAECSIRRVGVALAEHPNLARGEHTVSETIKILPIDVEV